MSYDPALVPIDPEPDDLPPKRLTVCNGACLWGHDIGVPEFYGIAYPHPDCEKHGAPMIDTTDDEWNLPEVLDCNWIGTQVWFPMRVLNREALVEIYGGTS